MIDLTNILAKNEDYLIEAKSAKGGFPDNFWETYSAFANTDGGTILLGVEETHDHVLYMQDGLADAQKMKETFWKLVNNRQKISHNIVTNSMVYIDQLEGKDILVVEVPRAERTTRPVYKGQDPRLGTYRRWGEGDHLCSMEEVSAMYRDASSSPLDAQPIEEMDLSVFCEDLPFDGHEQDVNAMLQLYDNAEELTFTETTEATTETATETSDNTTETTETSAVTTETYDSTTETIRLMIKENPKITGKELASRCGITEDGVAYHIKKLKASGKIKRKGGARNGGEWVVM